MFSSEFFDVIGNEFFNAGNATNIYDTNNAGIYGKAYGSIFFNVNQESFVMDNYYNALDFGLLTFQNNLGLNVFCNNFSRRKNESLAQLPFVLGTWANINAIKDQGTGCFSSLVYDNCIDGTPSPAGNKWYDQTNPLGQIFSNTVFQYHAHGDLPIWPFITQPLNFSAIVNLNPCFNNALYDPNSSCNDLFGCNDFTAIIGNDDSNLLSASLVQDYTDKINLLQQVNDYESQLDQGQTGNIIEIIVDEEEADIVFSTLLGSSPLSEEAIKMALYRDDLDDAEHLLILMENMPLTKDNFNDVLEREPLFSQNFVDVVEYLQNYDGSLNYLDVLQDYLNNIEEEKGRKEGYLFDEAKEEGDFSVLKSALYSIVSNESIKKQIEIALLDGNFSEYFVKQTELQTRNMIENEDLSAFNDYYSVYAYMLENEIIAKDLSQYYLNILSNIANYETKIGLQAKNILNANTGRFAPIPIPELSSTQPRKRQRPIDNSISLEAIINQKQIQLYPNPVSNKLNVKTSTLLNDYNITNLNGKIIQTGRYTNKIDVSNLSSGIYFIRFDNALIRHKFVKM